VYFLLYYKGYIKSTDYHMLKLSSNPKNVAVVEHFVGKICREYHIQKDIYGNILISLTEAVNNAIIHGNKNDESKSVHIQTRKAPDRIAIRVSDEGRGFDAAELPDPTCPHNLAKCGGRGVFLMKQLSDQIDFLDDGRTVEMHFKI